jgi:hypothetical protein
MSSVSGTRRHHSELKKVSLFKNLCHDCKDFVLKIANCKQ